MVAIIGIASLVVTPYFLKSIRGNRLRTAGRSVVMMGRYARSMALLHQRDMAMTFTIGGSDIRVQEAGAPATTNAALDPLAALLASPEPAPAPAPAAPPDDAALAGSTGGPPRMVTVSAVNLAAARHAEGVTFEYLRMRGGDEQREGIASVRYRMNGTCDPYEIRMRDQQDAALTISVDPLSSVRVEGGDNQTIRIR